MKTTRTVTLNDVAAEAKTSNATVSNYLNKTKAVSPVTARRIQSAIDKLGYQKDSMAAWFKTARAGLVIIAVANADTTFFSDVADAIEEECEVKGWSALRVKIRTLEKMLKGNDMSAMLKRAGRRNRVRSPGRMDQRPRYTFSRFSAGRVELGHLVRVWQSRA